MNTKTLFQPYLLLLILCLILPSIVTGQDQDVTFEIDRVELNQQAEKIELFLRYLIDGKPQQGKSFEAGEFKVTEQIEDGEIIPLQAYGQVVPDIERDTLEMNESLQVFLLVERSALIRTEDQSTISNILRTLEGKLAFSSSTQVYLSYFDSLLHQEQAFNTVQEKEQVLRQFIPAEVSDPIRLNRAIFQQLQRLNDYEGRKIVFLLSAGTNIFPPNEGTMWLPYNEEDVYAFLESFGSDLLFFTIGLGADPDEAYLQTLTSKSTNSNDRYTKGELPDNLSALIQDNIVITSTHKLVLFPGNEVFRGEERKIRVQYAGEDQLDDDFTYAKGDLNEPVILQPPPNLSSWALGLVLGFFILSAMLAFIFLLIPVIRKWQFNQKFVKPYQPVGNRRAIDPLTNEPIEIGEKVVQKCQQIVPVATWDGLGGQCPNYPDCLDYLNCNGAGGPEKVEGLFAMQGIYRNLNWLWFGALGGFIGWVLYAFFRNFGVEWYSSILQDVFSTEAVTDAGAGRFQDVNQWMEGLVNNTIIGVAFGFGFILMLSVVEERSQSRQLSWLRILLRVVLGVVLSLGVFWLGYYLEKNVVDSLYLSGLITWLLFGLVVGMVLAINSSISVIRGVLGGILASVVGFQFYWLLGDLWQDFITAKLVSLIVMGAILGWIIVTVIASLEDFELEYVSPSNVSNNIIPISKWLKSGLEVQIGTGTGCYVYVKWQDPEVQSCHATLTMDSGKVFLTPIGETLVRGYPSPKGQRVALRNGDVIQLGKESITRMRFKAK